MKKLLPFCLLFTAMSGFSQETENDFSTIDQVIATVYAVISGPAGERDWELFHDLYHDEAIMGQTGVNREGKRGFAHFTPQGYQEQNAPFFETSAFYEEEIGRITNEYGGVAQVFSAYQFRLEKDGEIVKRGVNSIQLIFRNDRWYITQLIWEAESENNPLPDWVK